MADTFHVKNCFEHFNSFAICFFLLTTNSIENRILDRRSNTTNQKMGCTFIWPELSYDFPSIGLVIFTGLTIVISLPGNLLTSIVIARSEELRSQSAYILICSVCIADTLVSSTTQPLYITERISGTRSHCIVDNIYFFLAWLSSSASVLGIISITIDRYFFIVYPLQYHMYMTKRNALILIATTWTVSVLFGFIPLLEYHPVVLHSMTMAILILLSIFMIITYIKVYSKITDQIENIAQTTKKNSFEERRKAKSQKQATRTVLLVVVSFFACWYPWTVTSLVIAIHENIKSPYTPSSVTVKMHYIFLSLGYANSALNVFIYGRKNSVLRGAVEKFLGIKKKNVDNEFTSVRSKVDNKDQGWKRKECNKNSNLKHFDQEMELTEVTKDNILLHVKSSIPNEDQEGLKVT